ncbi:uncharacterized protein LOC128723761 [Anopheles nili]|uniref:uncharacterized protein LOC128723761 n=1 Tax=Anopheles nili TaxID=185578 RepID=UPI00237AB97E|nr:uncharacterized protein LOC128723761 [Anopheles nili]
MSFTEGLVILSMGAFSCLLGVFQLVGFFNFPLRLHRRSGLAVGEHQWSSSICWIIQLIVTMVNGVLAKRNYNCLFNGLLLKDAMNNYFKFTLGLLTAIVTLADSWFCVETHRSIWMRYRALAQRDGTFLGLMDRGVTVHVLVRYMATFLLVVAVCILVEYKLYYGIAVGTQWHCFWMHNIYPYAISHFRHMFHLLHIALMAENLSQLQARLQRSIEQAGLHSGPMQRDATVALIMEECRAIYTELWFVNESINELFGFSQAFNIACSFAQIAFDLYWVYSIWLTNQENIDGE